LLDVATEELSHLEVVGSIVVMLNKGVKSAIAEGEATADLLATMTGGTDSHTTALLYGGGVPLTNSGGVPWTAAYVDTRGEPTADFRSNIAAEARAKIVYERLINLTDDPGVKEALGFLMTREVAHQKSFEKALYSITPNFPPGKLPGMPDFTDKYYDMSQGEGNLRGSWNQGEQWEFIDDRELQAAVDGGDGLATVKLTRADKALETKAMARTMSDPNSDPVTGAIWAPVLALVRPKPARTRKNTASVIKGRGGFAMFKDRKWINKIVMKKFGIALIACGWRRDVQKAVMKNFGTGLPRLKTPSRK
jgi:Mn-containing catalase